MDSIQTRMQQKSAQYLDDSLRNWSQAEIYTVPGIMYQLRCNTFGMNDHMEYRFHWFVDCAETYIHNHQVAFDSYCLEGRYVETLWEIFDDHSGQFTNKFPRDSGNKIIGAPVKVPGILRPEEDHQHYPGNVLHVETNEFHSIAPINKGQGVVTFVARYQSSSPLRTTHILSTEETIKAPTDAIRPATDEERDSIHKKFQMISNELKINGNFL